MKRILAGLVIFCLSVGVVSLSAQQQATVGHGVSLRGDPSTKNPPIGHLNRNATATLLALKPNTGFYHVQTADKVSAATYSAKISEFNSKLEKAQREQDDLKRRVKCLAKSDSDLEQMRHEQERALQPLLTKKEELKDSVIKQRATINGFETNLNTEEAKLAALTANLNGLQGERQAQEVWIQQCERDQPPLHLWGLSCRFDMDMSRKLGRIKNYDGEIDAAKAREETARSSMETAKSNLARRRTELDMTNGQATALDAQISKTETDISRLAKELSDIREVVQPLRILIDKFAKALNEAKDVAADDEPRTVQRRSDILGKIDAAISGSTDAVSQADKLGCPASLDDRERTDKLNHEER